MAGLSSSRRFVQEQSKDREQIQDPALKGHVSIFVYGSLVFFSFLLVHSTKCGIKGRRGVSVGPTDSRETAGTPHRAVQSSTEQSTQERTQHTAHSTAEAGGTLERAKTGQVS